jgi:tetratricopeptide (TPR) repeat protein
LSAQIALELGEFRELLTRLDDAHSGLTAIQKSIYRGRALAGMHQPAEAAAAFESALAADPRSTEAQVGLAEVEAAQGQLDAAHTHLDAALATDASDSAALLLLGNLRARQGDYAHAEEALIAARKNAAAQFTQRQQTALLAALVETQLLRGQVDAAATTRAALSKIAPEAVITRASPWRGRTTRLRARSCSA